MKKSLKKIVSFGLATALTFGLTACGDSATSASNSGSVGSTADNSTGKSDGEVRTIYYAFSNAGGRNSFIDENGNPDGYEFAAVKAIFDQLPQYELEFVPTADDDLLIGLQTGKYDIATKGAWWTADREENYVFPEHYIGSSIIGITYRTEDEGKFTDLESFAKWVIENDGRGLVPISPMNAQYNVVVNYNNNHPDAQIELVELDQWSTTDAYLWVLEGRYDAYFDIRSIFDSTVKAEDGEYHQYADQLSYITYEAIPTWAFFNKNNQDVADDFDRVWEELNEQGVFEELAQEYFGYSLFEYIPEGYKKGDDY